MKKETEKVIKVLKEDYGLDTDKIIKDVVENEDTDYIKIGDTYYSVYKGLDDNAINDTASYIYSSLDNDVRIYENNNDNIDLIDDTTNVEVFEATLSDVKRGKKYKYKPKNSTLIFDDDEDTEDYANEHILYDLAKFEPYCIVKDTLIVSKDENDGFAVVSFDLPENDNLESSVDNFNINEEFVVFPEDLEEIEEVEIKEDIDKTASIEETSTVLLEALDSEKDAVVTYERLLGISTKDKEKELLQKILDDEKEHISLLSALQASESSSFVANDNKPMLDGYVDSIVE